MIKKLEVKNTAGDTFNYHIIILISDKGFGTNLDITNGLESYEYYYDRQSIDTPISSVPIIDLFEYEFAKLKFTRRTKDMEEYKELIVNDMKVTYDTVEVLDWSEVKMEDISLAAQLNAMKKSTPEL